MTPSTKPLWQRFLVFLLPLMLSNILQALSGTINSVFIGQLIGVDALAAISVFFPILILLISFVVGLASGATILIGQAWGAKNLLKIKQVSGTTLTVGFLMGLVIAVLGVLFTREIMSVLGVPEDILGIATDYGRIMLLGMPGFFLMLIITSTLRGVGDTMTPLLTLGISIVAGALITPALILGWLGLPQLGVMSAAVAFIIGNVGVLAFLFFYLGWIKSPMAPDSHLVQSLKIDFDLLKLILKLGIPAGVSMIVASLAGIVIIGIVNRFGSNATAAYGAVNQVMSYVQFPAMSIGIAASIFAAQAIGARNFHEVEHVTRTALVINTLFTGLLVLIAYLFSEHLVGLFITDREVIALTETLLHIVLWSVILFGYGTIFSAVMRAAGEVWIPMALSMVAIVAIEVPAALLLSQWYGLSGVWWGYCLNFGAMMLLQFAYYQLVWRKKEITALV